MENYFPELRQNLEHLYLALYFCEVADYFTREGMTAKHELNLLYLSLRALSVPSLPEELVRYIYEFRMLAIAGEAPRIFECIRCGKTENLHHFLCGGMRALSAMTATTERPVFCYRKLLFTPCRGFSPRRFKNCILFLSARQCFSS